MLAWRAWLIRGGLWRSWMVCLFFLFFFSNLMWLLRLFIEIINYFQHDAQHARFCAPTKFINALIR
jgi:hypothetical protein